jgi:hypothetical protein
MMDLSGVLTVFSNVCQSRKNMVYCWRSKIIGDYVQLPEGQLRIKKAIDSPWLGILLIQEIFLKILIPNWNDSTLYKLCKAKTYYGGGEWYSLILIINK